MALSFTDYSFQVNYDPFGSFITLDSSKSATPPTFTTKPKPAPFKLKEGDRVNVKVDTTATIDYVNRDGSFDLNFTDLGGLDNVPSKFVTLADPENWPPKVGQVWKADGKLYGIRQNFAYSGEVVAYPIDQTNTGYSKGNSAGRTMDDFKRLRPTLVG